MKTKPQIKSTSVKTKLLFAVLAMAAGMSVPGNAATVFDENFDNSNVYGSDSLDTLPNGPGKINYGAWYSSAPSGTGVYTETDVSASSPKGLALYQNQDSNPNSPQVSGEFGSSNTTTAIIQDALTFECAFQVYSSDMGAGTFLSIRDQNSVNIAEVYLADAGELVAQFNSTTANVASIAAKTWYNLQLVMPAYGGSTSYTVNLYAADGTTLLGSSTGTLLEPLNGTNGYNYFTMVNASPAASILWTDNFIAETQAVPEPSALLMVLIGLGVLSLIRLSGYGVKEKLLS